MIFLAGIILFTSILVIGLFPDRVDTGLIEENFLITALMTMPIIAGIYLIVISFRRNLNIASVDIQHSIKKKMTMSFVFIAVLSAVPIVLISSNYFNSTLSGMFSGKTRDALDKTVELAGNLYNDMAGEIRSELESSKIFFINDNIVVSENTLRVLAGIYEKKGYNAVFIIPRMIPGIGNEKLIRNKSAAASGISDEIASFYRSYMKGEVKLNRIKVREHDLISGAVEYKNVKTIIWKDIPEDIRSLESLFIEARKEYIEVERRKDEFQNGTGTFLMYLSIMIIGIAYLISLYMSGSVTKPVLELSAASKEISLGNFNQNLKKRSDDELGLLMDSFNTMARQLEEKRKIMYQKQKLEAWNEMARKLVHEIKNPLTPIRLSAERMRKLTIEGSPIKDQAVISGSETIINEVSSLLKLVSEFSTLARMPEKKPELSSINKLINETVMLFSAHEKVEFRLELATDIPDMMIDRTLIRQALNNLITNAVQAMPDRGIITVVSRVDSVTREAVITVTDNGKGIKPSDIDRIFEPGYTSKDSGTGIGLSIVEKIIFEHDGTISCMSAEGDGTTFEIRLPLGTGV